MQLLILKVQVNGGAKGGEGVFMTPEMGDDNAIARHGIHGLQWSLKFAIPGHLLIPGNNTINMRVSQTGEAATAKIAGVMYDYIRMEGPSSGGVLRFAVLGQFWLGILFLSWVAFLALSQ